MGRPQIGPAIKVRLDADMLERVDALVSERGRAAFVREAVARELARRERAAGRG